MRVKGVSLVPFTSFLGPQQKSAHVRIKYLPLSCMVRFTETELGTTAQPTLLVPNELLLRLRRRGHVYVCMFFEKRVSQGGLRKVGAYIQDYVVSGQCQAHFPSVCSNATITSHDHLLTEYTKSGAWSVWYGRFKGVAYGHRKSPDVLLSL